VWCPQEDAEGLLMSRDITDAFNAMCPLSYIHVSVVFDNAQYCTVHTPNRNSRYDLQVERQIIMSGCRHQI
jgi:hypothetical protein